MGNKASRIDAGVAQVAGGLIGANLLTQFKADLVKQKVFQTLFGENGERIFISQTPSWNDTITPGLEMWWRRETLQSWDTYLTGAIAGQIVCPQRADAKSDPNVPRLIAAALARFLDSNRHTLFATVKGLIEFGVNAEFLYDRLIATSGFEAPKVDFTLPFKFDLLLLRQEMPEVDFDGDLDAALVGMFASIQVNAKDDNTDDPLALTDQKVVF